MKRFFSSIISSKKETKTNPSESKSPLKKSKSNDGTVQGISDAKSNSNSSKMDIRDDDEDDDNYHEPIVIVKERTRNWFGSGSKSKSKSKSKPSATKNVNSSRWNNMPTSILAKICAHAPSNTHLKSHFQFARVSKSFSIAARLSWSWPTKLFLEITYDVNERRTKLAIFARNSKIVLTPENFVQCVKALKGIKITNLILIYRPSSTEPQLKQLLSHLNFIELNSFMSYNPNLDQDPFLNSTLLKKCKLLKTIQINFNPNITLPTIIFLIGPAWQDLFKYNRAEFFGISMVRKNLIFDNEDRGNVDVARYVVISQDQLDLLTKNKSLKRLFLENVCLGDGVENKLGRGKDNIVHSHSHSHSLHTMTWLKVLKFKCNFGNNNGNGNNDSNANGNGNGNRIVESEPNLGNDQDLEEYKSALKDRQDRKARLKILPPTEALLFPDNLETLHLEKMSFDSTIPWFGNCKLLKKLTLSQFELKRSNELLFSEMSKFPVLETVVLRDLFPFHDLEENKSIMILPKSVQTLVLDDCINTSKWLLVKENSEIKNLTIQKTFIQDIYDLIQTGSFDNVENLELLDLFADQITGHRGEGMLSRLVKLKKLTITTNSYGTANMTIAKLLFKYLPTSLQEINVTITTNLPVINPLDEIMYKHTMENMVKKQDTSGMLPNLKVSKWIYK